MKNQNLERPDIVKVTTRIQPYGDYNHNTGEMRINPKRGDVVNTIIHEKLHHNYPNMDHEKVYELAAKIESKMTLPEMAKELIITHIQAENPVYVDMRPKTFTPAQEFSQEIKRKSA